MSGTTSIDLRAFIRDIPDFPKPGILFRDITPLLASHEAFEESIRVFADRFRLAEVERRAGDVEKIACRDQRIVDRQVLVG